MYTDNDYVTLIKNPTALANLRAETFRVEIIFINNRVSVKTSKDEPLQSLLGRVSQFFCIEELIEDVHTSLIYLIIYFVAKSDIQSLVYIDSQRTSSFWPILCQNLLFFNKNEISLGNAQRKVRLANLKPKKCFFHVYRLQHSSI